MFAKMTTLSFLVSATSFVLATPVPGGGHDHPTSGVVNSCNTGSIQCCQQFHDASSENISSLLGLLGIVASLTGQVGTSCTPITGIGLGQGASCHQAPMCCSGNHLDGAIAVGCNPINVSL